MTVAWTDFLSIAIVVNELRHAMLYFVDRGKNHEAVRTAAEKYHRCLENPAVAELMENARTGLKLRVFLPRFRY